MNNTKQILSNLDTNSTIPVYPCIPQSTGSILILMLLIFSPFHIFALVTIYRRFHEKFPRHMFVISLSAFDNLQIVITGFIATIVKVFQLKTTSTACQIFRQMIEFNGAFTLVGAGASIIALSAERYIHCVYCLEFHYILTEKRTKWSLYAIWSLASIGGCTVLHPLTSNPDPTAISRGVRFAAVYIAVVFPNSLIMLIIQSRLYKISRAKLKVLPGESANGNSDAVKDMRKRELKLAFVSSAVVCLYVFCMLPLGCLIFYALIKEEQLHVFQIRSKLSLLTMVNTAANPFVYGLGMKDIRKKIFKELKVLKEKLLGSTEAD